MPNISTAIRRKTNATPSLRGWHRARPKSFRNVGILTEGFDLPRHRLHRAGAADAIARAIPADDRPRLAPGAKANPMSSFSITAAACIATAGPTIAIEWTLDTDRARRQPDARSAHRQGRHRDPFCECNACGHLRMRGMACDNCGWEPKPPAAPVEYIDGDLVELGKPAVVRSETDRRIFLRRAARLSTNRSQARRLAIRSRMGRQSIPNEIRIIPAVALE